MRDFWSRRKAAVEAEARAEQQATEAALRAEEEAKLAERSDEELLAELDLPLPEEITNGEMVQRYLKSALPQRLKNRALRQLWKTNPVLANLDGLVDYDDDFTDAATCVPNLQTTYQVGKGLLAHIEHIAKTATETAPEPTPVALADDDALADDVPADPEDTPEDTPDNAAPEAPRDIALANGSERAYEPDAEPAALPASSRRMRFRFEAS